MALNPTLRQMVANAQAKYMDVDSSSERDEFEKSVTQQLVELALRKATKKELLQIVRRASLAN